jgi:tRNA 2-thiouridine synthesizing protein E
MKVNKFKYRGREYQVDSHGFLLDPKQWNIEFAEGMASDSGIPGELTEDHWKVISFIRNTFDKISACPLVYVACKKNDIGLGDLKRLFPTGYLRGACKLAGVTYRECQLQHVWLEEHIIHHTRIYERKMYETDVQGFLLDPSKWDENYALHKAYEMKMPDYLTRKHWDVIYFLREKYEETGSVPTIYETCEALNIGLEVLEQLFPDGYHRGAVKIAGLRVR